ncbi:unnamed protein product [Cunninghamella blakesleeana]
MFEYAMEYVPNEILGYIFGYSSKRAIIECSKVCKKWYQLTLTPRYYSAVHIYTINQLKKFLTLANNTDNTRLINNKPIRYYVHYLHIHIDDISTEYTSIILKTFPNIQDIKGLNTGIIKTVPNFPHIFNTQLQHLIHFPAWYTGSNDDWMNYMNDKITLLDFNTDELILITPQQPIHLSKLFTTSQFYTVRVGEVKSVQKRFNDITLISEFENDDGFPYSSTTYISKIIILPALNHLITLKVRFSGIEYYEFDERTFESIHQSCPRLALLEIDDLNMNISEDYDSILAKLKHEKNTMIKRTPSLSSSSSTHLAKNLTQFHFNGVIHDPRCYTYFLNKYPYLENLDLRLIWHRSQDLQINTPFKFALFDLISQSSCLKTLKFKLSLYDCTWEQMDIYEGYWPMEEFNTWLKNHPNRLTSLKYPYDISTINEYYIDVDDSDLIDSFNDDGLNITMDHLLAQSNYLNHLKYLSITITKSIQSTYSYFTLNNKRQIASLSLEELQIISDDTILDNDQPLYIYSWLDAFPNLLKLVVDFNKLVKDVPSTTKWGNTEKTIFNVDSNEDMVDASDIIKYNIEEKGRVVNDNVSDDDNDNDNQYKTYKLQCLSFCCSNIYFKNGFSSFSKRCPNLTRLSLWNVNYAMMDWQLSDYQEFIGKRIKENNGKIEKSILSHQSKKPNEYPIIETTIDLSKMDHLDYLGISKLRFIPWIGTYFDHPFNFVETLNIKETNYGKKDYKVTKQCFTQCDRLLLLSESVVYNRPIKPTRPYTLNIICKSAMDNLVNLTFGNGSNNLELTASFTNEELHSLMNRSTNIRHISLIGQLNHGKSTLAEVLSSKAWIKPPNKNDGDISYINRRSAGEMTIKSVVESLYYSLNSNNSNNNDLEEEIKKNQPLDGHQFLINLMDTPGHIDFTPEVTASLRISDGALVVVDCVDGIGMQTENVLRQALCDHIKPILVINKLDQALLKLQLKKEELYQSLIKTVEFFNTSISTYGNQIHGDLQVYPDKGTIIFASGLHGWGFTLNQFAIIYSKRFGVDKKKILKRLWGEHYFNFITKKWSKKKKTDEDNNGDHSSQRGFNLFVLDPIYRLYDFVLNHKRESLVKLLSKMNIQLTTDEWELDDKPLLKLIMKKFLPCDEALLQTICIHMPSPKTAQAYRTQYLYQGSMDDVSAIGMKHCDPNGPLIIYISKIIPKFSKSEDTKFYAFGRVFSGSVTNGTDVFYLPSSYQPSRNIGHQYLIRKTTLQQTWMIRGILMVALNNNKIDSNTDDNHSKAITAGNLIILTCKDPFLFKSGTITTSTSYTIKGIKSFSVAPIVQLYIDVQRSADLPKLINGLRGLELTDSSYTSLADAGEHIIFVNGKLHSKYCLKVLVDHFVQVPLKMMDQKKYNDNDRDDGDDYPLWVSYRETIKETSFITCMSKSPNKRNRVYMRASPLDQDLITAIEKNELFFGGDENVRAQFLHDQFHWGFHQAKNIWSFGPDFMGPNVLVHDTKGIHDIHEIQLSAGIGLQWTTKEGPLVEENLRGCRFNILDAVIDSSSLRRGGGQIIPVFRRVMMTSVLTAQPILQEPIYLVHIQCLKCIINDIHHLLQKHRGMITCEREEEGNHGINNNNNNNRSVMKIKAFLPVSESFSFNDELQKITLNQATCELIFSHWSTFEGNPLEPGNIVYDTVREMRIRKGFSENVPSLDRFNDKL